MFSLSSTLFFIINFLLAIVTFVVSILTGLLLNEILYKISPSYKLKHPDPEIHSKATWIVFWSLVALMIFLGAISASSTPKDKSNYEVEKMSGDFRIAIGNFSVEDGIEPELGKEIGMNTFTRIQKSISEGNNSDLIFTVWAPDKTNLVTSTEKDKRSNNAASLAQEISADVIVYGNIKSKNGFLQIAPEFYVASKNFYEAEEILGQYYLGEPIEITNYEDITDRLFLTKKLDARLSGLSKIILGLAYYSINDFDLAISELLSADSIENWGDNEGKHILYLLLGNSTIKNEQIDLAYEYYSHSLAIEPDYSRALLGKANVLYRQAILPVEKSNNPKDLDIQLIEQAIELLAEAERSTNQPTSSFISPKIHFEMGQIYFMMAYGGFLPDYGKAKNEFNFVLDEFDRDKNPGLKERCAESHARLGLIYQLENRVEEAINEYEIAIYISENPDRIKLFEESLAELRK